MNDVKLWEAFIDQNSKSNELLPSLISDSMSNEDLTQFEYVPEVSEENFREYSEDTNLDIIPLSSYGDIDSEPCVTLVNDNLSTNSESGQQIIDSSSSENLEVSDSFEEDTSNQQPSSN